MSTRKEEEELFRAVYLFVDITSGIRYGHENLKVTYAFEVCTPGAEMVSELCSLVDHRVHFDMATR